MSEQENCLIGSTHLGFEGHGIFSVALTFQAGSFVQGTGHYRADGPRAGRVLKAILETIGVDEWGSLKGQYARVRRRNGFIKEIGHIVEDRWLDLEKAFTESEGGSK